MRIVLFVHSIQSDWNNGNAHFLRGVASELIALGHDVRCYEPRGGWSLSNLRHDHGDAPLAAFRAAYPELRPIEYDLTQLALDDALERADVVIVHEWNPPDLVRRIGEHRRKRGNYLLFFHDTHHRAVSDPQAMAELELSSYDGVLVFGEVLERIYAANGWANRVFTWHEAADTRHFYSRAADRREGDVVWIGNFGDEERSRELEEFLFEPVQKLGLRARVYGVRYPQSALQRLERAGIEYGGYLPNFQAPEVYARFAITLHVPRRPYAELLPGIPTIRPFEALACQIPLISAPWAEAERSFAVGSDFIMVRDGAEMKRALERVLSDASLAQALRESGLRRVVERHTCSQRVRQLLRLTRLLRTVQAINRDSSQSAEIQS
jgi:spore maturation protein CgeB